METEELERYKKLIECQVLLNESFAIIDRLEKKFAEDNTIKAHDNIILFKRK